MEDKKGYLLRIDKTLYDRLERWAQEESRSVNAQIIHVLEYVLERRRLQKIMGKQKKSVFSKIGRLFQ